MKRTSVKSTDNMYENFLCPETGRVVLNMEVLLRYHFFCKMEGKPVGTERERM